MPKAKYDEIYQSIKRDIEADKYSYGELLPSENTFVSLLSCSRNTVRRAISLLIADGYVQPIHGKGVRIIYQPTTRTDFTIGGIESFKETAQRHKLSASTKIIEFSTLTIDDKLAAKTGFAAGEAVYYIRRVRLLDNKPLILDTNIFSCQLVPNLTEEVITDSIYEYIETTLNMQIGTSKRRITVEHASNEEKKLLPLNNYDCLAVITSQTFNTDGILFEYTESRHQPDSFCFQDTAVRRPGI